MKLSWYLVFIAVVFVFFHGLGRGEAKRADALKKNFFYDKSYAEMYRHLIHLGMNELTKDKKQTA